jgi:integrase
MGAMREAGIDAHFLPERDLSFLLFVQKRRDVIQTVISEGRPEIMAESHLKLVTPATVNRTVRPKRLPNSKLRTREYLTETEIERLMKAATRNRWGHRDATMVLVAYRHGLRASEVTDLRWEQVDFRTATLHVRRVSRARPAPIRSSGTSFGRCGGSSANRSLSHPLCLPRSVAHRPT